jgi:hypothetical protein
VADTAEGFVLVDVPQTGNPGDDRLLDGTLERARRAGLRIQSVYADRGFGTRMADQTLVRYGIADTVIPRRGKATARQLTRSWRRRYRFRNGLEGRISQLKRKGLRRTRLRGLAGAQIWSGNIALAHNLQRIAMLTA